MSAPVQSPAAPPAGDLRSVAADRGDPGGPAPRTGVIVSVLALAGISVALMQTLVIPIVGQLPGLVHASASDTAWAITATLLAAAVCTPISGRLGDMVGKRPVLLASLVMMVVGSVVCAFSDSLVPLVVGRALQGFASGVIPLGISLMRDVLPPRKLGPATALMSASLGVGGALGLPAAAIIAAHADWHVLFWVAAALGAVVFLLVLTLIPAAGRRGGGRLDVVGAVGLSAALLSLLLGVSKGEDWGWTSAGTLGCLGAGLVLALLWGWYELRAEQPLVDLRTTARRQVLLTNLASVMFGFSLFAMSLVIPQLVQLPASTGYGLGRSMLVAGLTLVPSGLVMMATAPVSATVSRRYGPKTTLMIGAFVVAVGYGMGTVLMHAVWQLAIVYGVIGAGVGFAYGSMPALIMSGVPLSETASANSFNTLVRSVGSSVSSAVAGAVLAGTATVVGTTSIPALGGFRAILAVASGTALVALVIAAFLPRHAPVVHGPHHPGQTDPAMDEAALTDPLVLGPDAPEPQDVPEPEEGSQPAPGVRGTVTTGGRPLPGALVTLTDAGAGREIARTTTGPDGDYLLAAPSVGTFLLVVATPHLAPHAALVPVADRLEVRDVVLAGQSVRTGRVPVPGAPAGDPGVPVTA